MELAAAAQESWLAYSAKVNATIAAGGNVSNMSFNMSPPTLAPTTTTVHLLHCLGCKCNSC